MRRQTRTNLMLLGMVLPLCAAAVAELKREEWHASRAVANVDARRVQEVRVACDACVSRRFQKSQGRWWMRAPYDLPASDAAVQRLLAIAAAPVRKRHAATEFDPHKLGLAPPQASLDIGELHLEFGTTDALNGDRYVRRDGEVLLVPDRFSAWLFAPPESELDRRLMPPPAVPQNLLLDGAERPDLLPAWSTVEAVRVVKPDAAGTPAGTLHAVELRDGNGRILALTLWRRGADYLVLRHDPDMVYAFDEAQAQRLLAPAP
jgi:hypothetical protein